MEAQHGFWIDVGGTFTDCLFVRPDGSMATHKLLSDGTYRGQIARVVGAAIEDERRQHDPPDFFAGWQLDLLGGDGHTRRTATIRGNRGAVLELASALPEAAPGDRYVLRTDLPAPVIGIRHLLGRRAADVVGPLELRLGTTRGTNALLERKGGRVGALVTAGFGDVFLIRDQRRPHLFRLESALPAPLYACLAEVQERITADGEILTPLDLAQAETVLRRWFDEGVESLAIALLHSYRAPQHEIELADAARRIGFTHVSLGHELSPLPGYLRCCETTVVNAYLQPPVAAYIGHLRRHLPEARILLMSSSGGLMPAETFRPKDSILSGPAGGAVGAAAVGEQVGLERVLAFDMGGTSTDVSRYDHGFSRRTQLSVADPETGEELEIVAPQLEIETVAAGGGSICGFDGVKPTVGPQSAGARPGPACYGAGGPLCLTDINVFLGRIRADQFSLPLDTAAVELRLHQAIESIAKATGQYYTPQELAAGYLRIANEHMAAAMRRISIQRGIDPREFALVAFGGAGGQHACAVAELLDIQTVLCHPLAGMLSAYGIGRAPQQQLAVREIGRIWSNDELNAYSEVGRALRASASESLGVAEDAAIQTRQSAELRYAGQEETLTIPFAGSDTLRQFAEAHEQRFGFSMPDHPVELVALAAEAETFGQPSRWEQPASQLTNTEQQAWFDDAFVSVPVIAEDDWSPVEGPALLRAPFGTVVVEPGWIATQDRSLVQLRRVASTAAVKSAAAAVDPIELELFHNRFSGVARDMGATLSRAALSTNIRERHDYSCALCDADGFLVAHAPHVPVHLGAIGTTVRAMLDQIREGQLEPLQPGDVLLNNDPYTGGSHLPDVTAISPVFDADGSKPIAFIANRAHHAEIGGITPGSMPPRATCLAEEGVVLRWVQGVDPTSGAIREAPLRRLLEEGPYPSRNVTQNLADLRSQVSANRRGARGLEALFTRHGYAQTRAYMEHLQAAASEKLRQALQPFVPLNATFSDSLDDGTPIAVAIEVGEQGVAVDFTGTGPVSETSLNATPAIVTSAVLYCLRCLVADEIPLNEGLLRRVRLQIPSGLLHPPANVDPLQAAGVAGGNVETSQRVVDCVLGAFGVVAASQGSMNNLTFGDETFGYYETIGGGGGAGPHLPGLSARHCHMTNTRLTDPEVLERRFPVRLVEFSIRRKSGGDGARAGGDGMTRIFEFLAPLRVTLLTQRRRTAPYGLAGGEPGQPGHNCLMRADGTVVALDWFAEVNAVPGDRLRIDTPGGGGHGRRTNR